MAARTALYPSVNGSQEEAEKVHEAEGTRLLEKGLWVAAACHFERWLESARRTDDPNRIVPALHALACTEQLRGEHATALNWLQQVAPYLDRVELTSDHRIRYRLNRFFSMHRLGMDPEAAAEMDVAVGLAAELGPGLRAAVHLNCSAVRARRHDWAGMAADAELALAAFRQVGDQRGEAEALLNQGCALLEAGDLPSARQALKQALALEKALRASHAPEVDSGTSRRGYILTELGRLAHREGDLEAALSYAAEALEVHLEDVAILDKEEVAKLSELFGRIFADQGEMDLALRYLNRAAAYFSQLGLLQEWERVVSGLAPVLQRRRGGVRSQGRMAVPGLDFLTAVLDMTDELESVDPYLRAHCERVSVLAVQMGRALGLDARQQRLLGYAGRLHDLGKVAVDAAILAKPGPLTAAEWERVRVHPVVGEEMLRPFGLDEEGLMGIRHHHERWDGSGYPDGLKSEAIPLLARVIAVADVYDALTSDRVYRRAHGHWQAVEMLQHMAGNHLDPLLVQLLIDMHENPDAL